MRAGAGRGRPSVAGAHQPIWRQLAPRLIELSHVFALGFGLVYVFTAFGVDALRERQGGAAIDRTSRLLVVADDGSPRFYREVERLLARHADRLLAVRVAAPAAVLAREVFGRDLLVRARSWSPTATRPPPCCAPSRGPHDVGVNG